MMWLINWIGLIIANIGMAYCMFTGMGGIIGYILGGVFSINTGVILYLWYNAPEDSTKISSKSIKKKTTIPLNRRSYY